jgi:hypothetical protein
MRKSYYFIVSATLLVLCIAFVIASVFWVKKGDYTDSDTNDKCTKNHSSSSSITEGAKCGAWDGKQCRRGTINNTGVCEAKGNPGPLILLILACVSLLTCIIMFILAFALGTKTIKAAAKRY